MDATVRPVQGSEDLHTFISFPWRVNAGDLNWVPPILTEQQNRLDPLRNPFWKTADFQLWLAIQAGAPVGRIAAINGHSRNPGTDPGEGVFGFFDCVNDPQVSNLLFQTAESWLKNRGLKTVLGPYNPSPTDEAGILVEGFESRPAILEAHNPHYYAHLLESAGYQKHVDLVARHWLRSTNIDEFANAFPAKLARAAALGNKRKDLNIRRMNVQKWDSEIELACHIYNTCLSSLPGNIPIPQEEFSTFARSFKPILDPEMALVAEIAGTPVGYALALLDVNEALQKVNGKLDAKGILRFWWYSRHLHRVSFKILMVLPEFQGRGIESVLIQEVAKVIWRKKYQEVEMSLTGDENEKSNRFQDHLGFKVYRRYRIYQKEL